MPLVSVIVLTLNSEKYIGRCLRSLELQTMKDFEVIVVDAGSTDGTERLARTFAGHLRWVALPGSDMGMARNRGILESSGPFVTFLDSDDFYLRRKLEIQSEELARRSAAAVTFCESWHFRTGRPERLGVKRNGAAVCGLREFLAGHNYNLGTMFMRRGLWDVGYRFAEGESGRYGEEWRLQLAMAAGGVVMEFNDEPLTVVELRPDSHTAWSRQYLMKEHALREFEGTARKLSSGKRALLNVEKIADAYRSRLLVANLLANRVTEAKAVGRTIENPGLRKGLGMAVAVAAAMPGPLVSGFIRRAWLLRQNRSFQWSPADESVLSEMRRIMDGGGVGARLPKGPSRDTLSHQHQDI